jgi:hypothetical protein
MGRKLMRVPLDFAWPMNMIWDGYINPYYISKYYHKCDACDRTGYNSATRVLSESFYNTYGHRKWVYLNNYRYDDNAWQHHLTSLEVEALVKEGRLQTLHKPTKFVGSQETTIFYHYDTDSQKWVSHKNNDCLEVEAPVYPTSLDVNEWSRRGGLGHDCINCAICVKTRALHLGIYGLCDVCHGHGEIWTPPEARQWAEDWDGWDPPEGDGYQLWETTSEGSPTSPVFRTLEELCFWCEENATTFGSFKATAEEWRSMLAKDCVAHKIGNMIFM